MSKPHLRVHYTPWDNVLWRIGHFDARGTLVGYSTGVSISDAVREWFRFRKWYVQ